jgi:hypothetical protein
VAYYGELPAGGGGAGYFLGGAEAGGPGTLSGGSDPSGCVEVCALIKLSDSFDAHVANQVLGPLPPEGTTWGRVKAVYR